VLYDECGWEFCSMMICCCIASMFLDIVSIILARSELDGSVMAGAEEAVEWVGDEGAEGEWLAVEEDERWPEDHRTVDTRLSRASTPRLGVPDFVARMSLVRVAPRLLSGC
jgi:hypothetical protein